MKKILQKFPILYSLLQRFYYSILYLVERIVGTALHEWRWKIRHRIKKDWSQGYIKSTTHPHRDYLIEKIAQHAPFRTALEVGCNAGPNLYLLAKRFPTGIYYGIDINKDAIVKGQAWLTEQGVSNINLSTGKADNLKRFTDASIDIVFTDATLLYIGPDKINAVLSEMLRICKKAIILLEFHTPVQDAKEYLDARWIYDFVSLAKKCAVDATCKVSELPADGWDDQLWQEYGSFIEIIPTEQP